MILPESLQFLRAGWWLLHVASIGVVLAVGHAVGEHGARPEPAPAQAGDEHSEAPGDAHAPAEDHPDAPEHGEHAEHGEHVEPHHGADAHAPAGHHAHTTPEALVPLMQKLLVDTVQLQGAIEANDLPRAASHADAIAGACDDDPAGAHEDLPADLGPAFREHDRALHQRASDLAEALRGGDRARALGLQRDLVDACQSCHQQAPAAQAVDLWALATTATHLTSAESEENGSRP